MKRHLCVLLAFVCPLPALAQSAFNQNPISQVAKPPAFQAVPLLIEYRPQEKPRKGALTLRLRESGSGAQASVNLTPSAADSALFQGLFFVQFPLGDRSEKVLEFTDGRKTLLAVQKIDGRLQSVRLVETEEEWRRLSAAGSAPAAPQTAAVEPSPQEIARLEEQARAQARREEQNRLDLERREAMKREEALKQQAALSAAQKKKRQEEAARFGDQGMEAYRAGEFGKAAKLFAKAIELDPENDTFYHQAGVTLYKTEDYNASLAMFSLAEGDQEHQLERSYYIALNQMKLKEYDKALKELKDIRDENDPALSPIASFFAGNIEFQTQNYGDARKSFDYVLDQSKDPQLDAQAEQMLEQVDRAESFMASSKERFRFSATVGGIYDSNVLNISQQNLATDAAAYRVNYGATLGANLWRSYPSELGAQLGVNDYYSVDKKFKGDATLQAADALEWSLSLPYKTQVDSSARSYLIDITPAAKSLYMAPTGGTRKSIATSTVVNANVTTALSNLWMTRGGIEWGADNFTLDVASPDDEQTGTHYALSGSLTRLLDLRGATSLTGDLSYMVNASKGVNNRYKKTTLAATYGFPVFKETLGALRVDYATQDYNEAMVKRSDKITNATLSASTALNKKWSLTVSALTSNSTSDVETYKYDKYMVSALLTYTLSILKD